MPAWSPDGSEIAFYSAQGGTPRVWHVGSGGGTPEPFEEAEYESFVADCLAWAPGSKIIHRTVGIRNFSVFDPTTGASSPLVDADSLGYIFQPCWSPDGERVAFFWNREDETPPMGAWVKDIADGSLWKIAETVVNPVGWTPDGEWVWGLRYDMTAGGLNEVFRIPAEGGDSVPWVELPFDNVASDRISMTPDGRRFVYSKAERHADAWIIENFDPDVE
jgi:Tol biopolymer transport system component